MSGKFGLRLMGLVLGTAALPGAAIAHDHEAFDDRTCRNGGFAGHESFQVAVIRGEGPAFLLGDEDACPEAEECQQAGNPYVLPDQTVIVSRVRMDHACVFYPNDVGGSAGYLPLARLRLRESNTMPPRTAWLGEWGEGNPQLVIERRGNGLHVTGEAFWPGRPGEHDYPTTNLGQLDGRLTILGNRARYDDGNCIVDFTLLQTFLIASDNFRCGGNNVRFRDVLTRL